MRARLCGLGLAVALASSSSSAADLSGVVFHDRDGDGLQEPGEEGLAAQIEVYGIADAGGVVDRTLVAAGDGSFLLGPADIQDGCYVFRVTPPAGFRLGLPRSDCPGDGRGFPVGTRRYGAPRWLIDRLRAGSVRDVGLGDSIAEPASACTVVPADNTDYLKWLGERLGCIAPVDHHNEAIGGHQTDDLLQPAGTCQCPVIQDPLCQLGLGPKRCNNIHDAIARNPDLITVSIGGNDWLGSEPDPARQGEPFDPADVRRSVGALVAARANAQEALSVLATQLPTTDVVVNTVYDNLASSCASTAFHDIWIPIWMRMIREVVWGQGDRFQIAEIHPEYAHQDLNGGRCCGEQDRICSPVVDGIHPSHEGARIHLEKVWEALGGVNLGSRDGIGATSNGDLDLGMVELLATRLPSIADDRGASATAPDRALVADDRGALVVSGPGELVLSGFDARPDDIVISQVVVAVRYRTTGPAPAAGELDGHFFEASVDGSFAPPAASVTGWNTVTPIVGAGATAPEPNAMPDVPAWREVRAVVAKNLLDDGRATGRYDFPPLDFNDIASLAVRLRFEVRGAADTRAIEWDAAWLEIYGGRTAAVDFDVYRADTPVALVQPGNAIAAIAAGPYDDTPPAGPAAYYAVDDGGGRPAIIRLTAAARGSVRLHW